MTPFERLFGFSPRSGFCIFCTRKLIPEIDDFAVCNDCWNKTFPEELEYVDEPEEDTYVEFIDGR